MQNGKIYTVTVNITGIETNIAGRYDSSINAVRNLKKPTLFCSLDGSEKIIAEYDSLKHFKTCTNN